MLLRVVSVMITVAFIGGCGGGASAPSMANAPAVATTTGNDLPGLTNQLVAQLKTVQDEASAKAARPKIEGIADKIHELQQLAKSGKAPVPANVEDFANRQEAAMKAYAEQLARISEIPAAAQELQGMIQKLTP